MPLLPRLQDWRCLWCRATVHTTCRSSYVTQCSLGPTRHAIVPPTRLVKLATPAVAAAGRGGGRNGSVGDDDDEDDDDDDESENGVSTGFFLLTLIQVVP